MSQGAKTEGGSPSLVAFLCASLAAFTVFDYPIGNRDGEASVTYVPFKFYHPYLPITAYVCPYYVLPIMFLPAAAFACFSSGSADGPGSGLRGLGAGTSPSTSNSASFSKLSLQ